MSDAWHPQINGVVTTLSNTRKELVSLGFEVKIISPDQHRSVKCPTYPEISLALVRYATICKEILSFQPHAIHIATEGPLGWLARRVCQKHDFCFTTSYHTKFPEYIRLRYPIPLSLSYGIIRHFHAPASKIMVTTEVLQKELSQWNIHNTAIWTRGVNTRLFRPRKNKMLQSKGPVMTYLGRVSVEKNLPDFLNLNLSGTKCVIGDGPDMEKLRRRYPNVIFTGYKSGEELAQWLASADVLVFPSRTDTYGVVLLEAMACGVPAAAYPVTGPVSVIQEGVNGALDNNLEKAIQRALYVNRHSCRKFALSHSWENCTREFLGQLKLQDTPLTRLHFQNPKRGTVKSAYPGAEYDQ